MTDEAPTVGHGTPGQGRRALVVLGMHRSGTSALTRVLALLGARLPSNTLAANPDNPRGFWESQAIVRTHEELLSEQDSFWHDILPISDDWYASSDARRFEDLLVEDLRQDFGDAPLVVIKDPRMCRLMPLWTRVLERAGLIPTFIITLRDAVETAASLQRRDGFPLEKGLLLWLTHMHAAETGTRGMSRVFVSYEGLLRDWRMTVRKIGSRAGVQFDLAAASACIEDFLLADLRHAAPPDLQLERREVIGSWVQVLSAEYGRVESGQSSEIDFAAVDGVYRTCGAFLEAIRPVEGFSRRRLVELTSKVGELVNQVNGLQEQLAGYRRETARLQRVEGEARHLQARLAAIEASMSWRVTAPLRWLKLTLWQAKNGVWGALRSLGITVLRGARAFYRHLPLPVAWKQLIRARLAVFLPRLIPLLQGGWPAWNGADAQALEAAFSFELPGAAVIDENTISISPCCDPEISVIIPVFNNLDFTLACLESVARQSVPVGFEVIVIDDYSSDRTAEVLPRILGLRYLRNDRNLGFIRSCNRAAAEARGQYLAILNNDTYVQPGWLAELHRTMLTEKGAGLVGSQLLYPDGTLQEAGGLVWSDGSAWNYGRGLDRRRPEFNYLRDVDYCSGASLFIAADLFREFGGFDAAFEPAYYEDTDLAFKVRRKGLRVLYQPLSRVVHHEGITSGTDINSGVKRFQMRNQGIFLNRWKAELANHASGPGTEVHLDGDCTRSVLVIDSCTPTPDRDSGSVDAVQLMRNLRDMQCAVTFIADDELNLQEKYTAGLQRIGVRCEYRPFIDSAARFLEEMSSRYDVVILTRFGVAERLLGIVRRCQPQARVAFIAVDLHHLRLIREADVRGSEKLAREAMAIRNRELAVTGAVDLTVVKSQAEIALLERELPQAKTFMLPLIIDTPGRRRTGFRSRANFVFVGGFRHPPNVDSILHFVREEWPSIRTAVPDATLLVIGSEAPREVSELRVDGVDVVGYVEDLAPYLNYSRVMVAPLRFGAGVKGKVGRSLGYGLPCVATPVAVEGMGLTHDREVVVADLGDAFVRACVGLYQDERRWSEMAAAGRKFFEENYSEDSGRRVVRCLLEQVTS